jgi:hypothetical protein
MAHSSPQKRKRRRVQLRDAQRRRRARLKTESKSFLQIILSKETLELLRSRSDAEGKPLHICATEILESGLSVPIMDQHGEGLEAPAIYQVTETPAIDQVTETLLEEPSVVAITEEITSRADPVPVSSNQMELFARPPV